MGGRRNLWKTNTIPIEIAKITSRSVMILISVTAPSPLAGTIHYLPVHLKLAAALKDADAVYPGLKATTFAEIEKLFRK